MIAYVGGVSLICVLVILNIFAGDDRRRAGAEGQGPAVRPQPAGLDDAVHVAKCWATPSRSSCRWLVLTAAAIVVIDVSALPTACLPFLLTVLVYLLLYYCVLLAVALIADSTGLARVGDHVGNISVNFLIPFLLGCRPCGASRRAGGGLDARHRRPSWCSSSLVAVDRARRRLYVRSRRTDFV